MGKDVMSLGKRWKDCELNFVKRQVRSCVYVSSALRTSYLRHVDLTIQKRPPNVRRTTDRFSLQVDTFLGSRSPVTTDHIPYTPVTLQNAAQRFKLYAANVPDPGLGPTSAPATLGSSRRDDGLCEVR